ncbi:MAG: hypothetical protein QM680_01325 [Luteolibacter sp.]
MRLFFISLFSSIVCGVLSASGQSVPKENRTCRILFLGGQNSVPKVYLNDGVNTQLIKLSSLNLSDVYEVAPGNITLKLSSDFPSQEKPLPAGAPSVVVPESMKDCYLLVASDPKNSVLPLKLQVINASPSDFRPGQMLWLNLTPYHIGGQLGNKTLDLKAHAQVIVDAPRNDNGGFSVNIGYEPGNNQKAIQLVSTQWLHNSSGRNVIFVMLLPNSQVPRIKGFSDLRMPKTEKSPSSSTR